MNNKKSKSVYLIIIVGMILLVAAGYFLHKGRQKRLKREEIEKISQEATEIIPAKVEAWFSEDEIVEKAECDFISTGVKEAESGLWLEWRDHADVKIFIKDEFDSFDTKKQYEIISEYRSRAIDAVYGELEASFPNYRKLGEDDYLFELYGRSVSDSRGSVDVELITTGNTYQYSEHNDDYYVKNGDLIYAGDEKDRISGYEYDGRNSDSQAAHVCETCGKKATHSIEGFNGTLDWYCDEHWEVLMSSMYKIFSDME